MKPPRTVPEPSTVPLTWAPDIVAWIVTVEDPEIAIVPSTFEPVCCRVA